MLCCIFYLFLFIDFSKKLNYISNDISPELKHVNEILLETQMCISKKIEW